MVATIIAVRLEKGALTFTIPSRSLVARGFVTGEARGRGRALPTRRSFTVAAIVLVGPPQRRVTKTRVVVQRHVMAFVLQCHKLWQVEHFPHRITVGENTKMKQKACCVSRQNTFPYAPSCPVLPNAVARFIVIGVTIPEWNNILIVPHRNDSATNFVSHVKLLANNGQNLHNKTACQHSDTWSIHKATLPIHKTHQIFPVARCNALAKTHHPLATSSVGWVFPHGFNTRLEKMVVHSIREVIRPHQMIVNPPKVLYLYKCTKHLSNYSDNTTNKHIPSWTRRVLWYSSHSSPASSIQSISA